MTMEKINYQPEKLMFAFRSKERDHIHVLTQRANYLLQLMVNKQATKEEKQEYYSLKWMMKQVCAIDNDNLEKVNETTSGNDG